MPCNWFGVILDFKFHKRISLQPVRAICTKLLALQGRPLLKLLTESSAWGKVYAVSRRPLGIEHDKIQHLALDLYDEKAVSAKLSSEHVKDVTHIFHLAFAGDMTNMDKAVHKMLEVLLTTVEQAKCPLQHVYFTTGLKYYGKLRNQTCGACCCQQVNF